MLIESLPDEQIDFQEMIIAQITGEQAIHTTTGDTVFIKSRWSNNEKYQARKYFSAVIEKFGLNPKTHAYQLPNVNVGVDLLIEPLSGKNLYTLLPSTIVSDEYVVIGAHYDTGGKGIPGAIDNGSGIALILGVLRKAQKLELRKKNLIVIFFDQEEEDISAGSTAFAKYIISKSYDVHSVHSFDMIGWDGDGNKEVEIELPQPEIEKIYRKHAALLNIPIYATKVNSSDHYSFIKNGINAVGVSQAYAKGDNSGKKDTPEDKYPLVNFEYLSSCTDLAFEVIKEIIQE